MMIVIIGINTCFYFSLQRFWWTEDYTEDKIFVVVGFILSKANK